MEKDTGQPARSADVAPRDVQPTSLLQFKQSLAQMSYDEQVAAIQPDTPILLNAGVLADSVGASQSGTSKAQGKQVQCEEGPEAPSTDEAGVTPETDSWTFWGFGVGDQELRSEHVTAVPAVIAAARERVLEAGLPGSRYYLAFDWIEGWASPEGGERQNRALSYNRAKSVVAGLLEPSGRTDEELQLAVGKGESGDPDDPTEWHFRRSAVVLLRPVSDLEEERCEYLTVTGCENEAPEPEPPAPEEERDDPTITYEPGGQPRVGVTVTDRVAEVIGSPGGQAVKIGVSALAAFFQGGILAPISLVGNFFLLALAGARELTPQIGDTRAMGAAYGFTHSANGTFSTLSPHSPEQFFHIGELNMATLCATVDGNTNVYRYDYYWRAGKEMGAESFTEMDSTIADRTLLLQAYERCRSDLPPEMNSRQFIDALYTQYNNGEPFSHADLLALWFQYVASMDQKEQLLRRLYESARNDARSLRWPTPIEQSKCDRYSG